MPARGRCSVRQTADEVDVCRRVCTQIQIHRKVHMGFRLRFVLFARATGDRARACVPSLSRSRSRSRCTCPRPFPEAVSYRCERRKWGAGLVIAELLCKCIHFLLRCSDSSSRSPLPPSHPLPTVWRPTSTRCRPRTCHACHPLPSNEDRDRFHSTTPTLSDPLRPRLDRHPCPRSRPPLCSMLVYNAHRAALRPHAAKASSGGDRVL